MKVEKFVFGPFAENTYIVYDDSKECIIIDPGCTNPDEASQLKAFVENHQLKPVRLINTHCHVDHVMGNRFVADTWGLSLECPRQEMDNLNSADETAQMMGLPPANSPQPGRFIQDDPTVTFGNSELKLRFTPGHAPGHVSLLSDKEDFIISGDVIFQAGIGRTDLPGGDYKALMKTIKEKILVLDDNCTIYPGHGPETTVRFEKDNNPFVLAEFK